MVTSADGTGRENMAEFILKKREMGLVRMSMATKLHEIRKLDEEAERGEKRIKQQEDQLEEVVQKFEDYLKDNDMKAVEAMRRAEQETKGKQEKAAEIKKLNVQIQTITTEKNKYEEQMQACIKFKKFLDELTPYAWFRETLANIETQRKRQELEGKLEEELREDPDIDPAEIAEQRAQIEQALLICKERLTAETEELSDKHVVSELNVMDPDVVPMFFTDPEKILNIFMETEENNLFLIQNCQETEESLEELKSKFQEAKTKMDEDAANLKSQIETIRGKIGVEDQKKRVLVQRMAVTSNGEKQKELENEIQAKVGDIYKNSGFGENDANISTLGMLTKIESKLEELRVIIAGLEHKFVSDQMKQRDKERRQTARQQHLDQQQKSREERSKKALARAQAPVRKTVGKPVMWRSRPEEPKTAEDTNTEENGEDVDDSIFFKE